MLGTEPGSLEGNSMILITEHSLYAPLIHVETSFQSIVQSDLKVTFVGLPL